TYAAQNQGDQALAFLREESKRSPNSNIVRSMLAGVALDLGKYDVAIEEYRRLAEVKPPAAEYYLGLGRAYRLKGDLPSAIENLREAGALSPSDPAPPALLAEALVAS